MEMLTDEIQTVVETKLELEFTERSFLLEHFGNFGPPTFWCAEKKRQFSLWAIF